MSYIQKRGKNTAWRESMMRNLTTRKIRSDWTKS